VERKILVVEDDPEQRELLRYNLMQAGFAVGTACDGIEGLKKARSLSPNLILLDLMLPELDGFAVCEILSRDPRTSAVPIIILTALSGHLARLSGLDAGARHYLTKPVTIKHLMSRINEALRCTADERS
jgi:DNA-binding response OmpR family regulator